LTKNDRSNIWYWYPKIAEGKEMVMNVQEELLLINKKNNVVTLTLNRPAKKNWPRKLPPMRPWP
jgi:hypothetical protein